MDLLRLARTVYDVAHPERPWGWKVAAYLWTKSIAAGAFLVAALGASRAGFLHRGRPDRAGGARDRPGVPRC